MRLLKEPILRSQSPMGCAPHSVSKYEGQYARLTPCLPVWYTAEAKHNVAKVAPASAMIASASSKKFLFSQTE